MIHTGADKYARYKASPITNAVDPVVLADLERRGLVPKNCADIGFYFPVNGLIEITFKCYAEDDHRELLDALFPGKPK